MSGGIMRRKEVPKPAQFLTSCNIRTTIDESAIIHGDLELSSSLLFKGVIKGALIVKCPEGTAVIGSKAKIKGGVIAENIMIFGDVEGPIKCRNVRFMSGSSYKGSLEYSKMQMDTGSIVNTESMKCKEFAFDESADGGDNVGT